MLLLRLPAIPLESPHFGNLQYSPAWTESRERVIQKPPCTHSNLRVLFCNNNCISLINLFITYLNLLAEGEAQLECAGLPDGSHGHGCQSYTRCTNGTGVQYDCPLPGLAFDYETGTCEA